MIGSLDATEQAAFDAAMSGRCQAITAAMTAKLDTDGDGAVSAAELEAGRAGHPDRMAGLLAKHDADGNGLLSDSERAHIRADRLAALDALKAELLAKYDTDGDGTLSAEEALPLRKDMQRRIAEGSAS